MPPPIQAKHLDHLTLVVADLDATRNFYCNLLGMQQVDRPAFSFPGSWFQLGDMMVHIILEHEGSCPAGNPAPPDERAKRSHHIAFELAGDPDLVLAAIQEHNVPIIKGPQVRPDNAFQLFVQDPDGHVIELSKANHQGERGT